MAEMLTMIDLVREGLRQAACEPSEMLRVTIETTVGPLEISCEDRQLSPEEIPLDGETAKTRGFSSLTVLDREGRGLGWVPLVGPIQTPFRPTQPLELDRSTPENPAGAPPTVLEAIERSFPREAREIIRSLRFTMTAFDQYWHFHRWDHFVGVEPSGYIHS